MKKPHRTSQKEIPKEDDVNERVDVNDHKNLLFYILRGRKAITISCVEKRDFRFSLGLLSFMTMR